MSLSMITNATYLDAKLKSVSAEKFILRINKNDIPANNIIILSPEDQYNNQIRCIPMEEHPMYHLLKKENNLLQEQINELKKNNNLLQEQINVIKKFNNLN
jgi:hypothetical protein